MAWRARRTVLIAVWAILAAPPAPAEEEPLDPRVDAALRFRPDPAGSRTPSPAALREQERLEEVSSYVRWRVHHVAKRWGITGARTLLGDALVAKGIALPAGDDRAADDPGYAEKVEAFVKASRDAGKRCTTWAAVEEAGRTFREPYERELGGFEEVEPAPLYLRLQRQLEAMSARLADEGAPVAVDVDALDARMDVLVGIETETERILDRLVELTVSRCVLEADDELDEHAVGVKRNALLDAASSPERDAALDALDRGREAREAKAEEEKKSLDTKREELASALHEVAAKEVDLSSVLAPRKPKPPEPVAEEGGTEAKSPDEPAKPPKGPARRPTREEATERLGRMLAEANALLDAGRGHATVKRIEEEFAKREVGDPRWGRLPDDPEPEALPGEGDVKTEAVRRARWTALARHAIGLSFDVASEGSRARLIASWEDLSPRSGGSWTREEPSGDVVLEDDVLERLAALRWLPRWADDVGGRLGAVEEKIGKREANGVDLDDLWRRLHVGDRLREAIEGGRTTVRAYGREVEGRRDPPAAMPLRLASGAVGEVLNGFAAARLRAQGKAVKDPANARAELYGAPGDSISSQEEADLRETVLETAHVGGLRTYVGGPFQDLVDARLDWDRLERAFARWKAVQAGVNERLRGWPDLVAENVALFAEQAQAVERFARAFSKPGRDPSGLAEWRGRRTALERRIDAALARAGGVVVGLAAAQEAKRGVRWPAWAVGPRVRVFAVCASGLRETRRIYAGVPTVVEVVFDERPEKSPITAAVETGGRKLKLLLYRDRDEPNRYTSEVFTTSEQGTAISPDDVFDPPPPPKPEEGR